MAAGREVEGRVTEHFQEFYVHPRKELELIDEFHELEGGYKDGEIRLTETKGGTCRLLSVPSGHLQKIYERMDVDKDYVYEVEFAPVNLIGFAKLTAKYNSDKRAIHIKRQDAQINSSVGEAYVTLRELKDLLGAYQNYIKANANMVENDQT